MSNSRNLLAANTDDTSGQDMETSQLGHGDKSNQPIAPVDSAAVDQQQAQPANEVGASSDNRSLPVVRVDDSAAQGLVTSEEGLSEGTQIASPTGPSLIPQADEDDSVLQPGRRVPERDLPSELSGALTKIRELQAPLKKTGDKNEDGLYADVFEGVLGQPDGSKIKVAIKSIRRIGGVLVDENRFNRRVRREAFIWMKSKHPNILDFIGYKVLDGAHCLVSPWCQHGSLARYIANKEGIKDSEKLKLLCDAARGLEHLHSLTPVIIHGDVKPDNVLVKDDFEAALCDFGVSRVFVGIGKISGLTTTGNRTGGTSGYQAKELLDESAPSASAPGDVYAFGGLILAVRQKMTLPELSPFAWGKCLVQNIIPSCQALTLSGVFSGNAGAGSPKRDRTLVPFSRG
ncbi:hypothetical protein FRC01_006221, partial [Tulasnella sp. 417]